MITRRRMLAATGGLAALAAAGPGPAGPHEKLAIPATEGEEQWRSNEAAHGLPARAQRTIFTGPVRVDPLFQAPDPARVSGASVTFEPGARTAWHTHPLGQALIVTAGNGRVQRQGGPIEQVRPGDVVWFPPGEKHWQAHRRRPGGAGWQDRRLDGARQRRAIPGGITC